MPKNQLIPSVHSWDTVNSRVPSLVDHAQPKNFRLTFNFCQFVSACKNEVVSSICTGEIVDLKILPSDCLRTFWPIS